MSTSKKNPVQKFSAKMSLAVVASSMTTLTESARRLAKAFGMAAGSAKELGAATIKVKRWTPHKVQPGLKRYVRNHTKKLKGTRRAGHHARRARR
jgi:hypothetical protein